MNNDNCLNEAQLFDNGSKPPLSKISFNLSVIGCPAPVRIQRSRQHKQVSPNGLPIVYVGRPTQWGNPFKIDEPIDNLNLVIDDRNDFNYYHEGRAIQSRQEAVELFMRHCITPKFKSLIRKELKGKNLSCWCPLSCSCHADILLKIANEI